MKHENTVIKTHQLNFHLPEELIALHPVEKRDACRLLIVNKTQKNTLPGIFQDLLGCLEAGDLLVFNNTLVDKARIYGNRISGGKHEFVLLESKDLIHWLALGNKTKRLKIGDIISFENSITAKILKILENGKMELLFSTPITEEILNKIGEVPLPPYIRGKRKYEKKDEVNYQTVYASQAGSKAAPTAGLHFTHELLEKLKEKGVQTATVQLFVSLGTFEPIRTEYVHEHKIHSENYFISETEAIKINEAIKEKRRIIAVGTTVVRTIESAFNKESNEIQPGKGQSTLFILPGYQFNVIKGLVTNFHTPGSTLLLLVSAFLGSFDLLLEIYETAVKENYRFFSYGDAMLIL